MIIVPYVPGGLHPATAQWMKQAHEHRPAGFTQLELGFTAELDPDDPAAYWRLLADIWEGLPPKSNLTIVEQDIVPAPHVIAGMYYCRRPWCVSPYPITEQQVLARESLGCTKFAARLHQRHPDLMRRLGEMDGDGLPAKDWRRLDVRLAKLLRSLGYAPHQHRRSQHMHDYTPARKEVA